MVLRGLFACLLGGCVTFDAWGKDPAPPVTPPAWFALGADVYRASEVPDAAAKTLQLQPEPRWFQAFPKSVTQAEYDAWKAAREGRTQQSEASTEGEPNLQIPGELPVPRRVNDVPLESRGTRLSLGLEPSTIEGSLRIRLALSTKERPVRREMEHRSTNVLPFLFHLQADGQPIVGSSDVVDRMGGSHSLVELVPAQQTRTWTLQIDQASLERRLPAGTKVLTLTAAFSERQHVPWVDGEPALGEVWNNLSELTPQLLVRSNALELERTANGWRAK